MSRGGAPLKAPQGVTGHGVLYVRLDPARSKMLNKLVAAANARSGVAVVAKADVVRMLIDDAFGADVFGVRSGGRR